MTEQKIYHAKIIGTGSYAPEAVLSNQDLEKVVDTTDEWIFRRSGIKERRITTGDRRTSDNAADAARQALEMAGVEPSELDLITVGTVTNESQFPSCACLLQNKLGAGGAGAMDISAGCSGFIYALSIANNAIRLGEVRYALVVGAETLSSVMNWDDRSTCVLLGDGAGAVVLGRGEGRGGILATRLNADGAYGDLLYSTDDFEPRTKLTVLDPPPYVKPFHLVMDGKRLFKKAIKCLEDVTRATLDQAGVSRDEISLVVPHQANIRIINALAERLELPSEKVYTTIHKYGNTSSASIPMALNEAYRAGRLKPGDKLMMMTFGAGLTWGGALVEWSAS